MRRAVTLWATRQWRRRWATLMLAGLVFTLTGALALGAATGARRAVSAFDRLRHQTFAAEVRVVDVDVEALGGQAGPEELLQRLFPLIGAEGATAGDQFFIFPVGYALFPSYDFYSIVDRQLLDGPANRPVVVSGRMPAPAESDELALSQQLADLFGVGVGDTITFDSASSDWVRRSFSSDPGPKDGPTLEFAITGVVVSPLDFAAPSGVVYLTTAFGREYSNRIGSFSSYDIRLDDQVRADEMIRTGSPNSGDDALDAAFSLAPSRWGNQQQVSDGLRVVGVALWVFAGSVAVAGLATLALIIKRLTRSVSGDVGILSTLGVGPVARTAAGALLFAPVIAFGVVGAFIGALGVVPFTRLGLAEQVEPDRGTFIDWRLLTAGSAVLALTVMIITAVLFLSVGRGAGTLSTARSRPEVKHPIVLMLGIREALGYRGPGRAAVIAAAPLMSAVVMSLVVGASLDRLPASPALWGGGSDIILDFGERSAGEPNVAYDQALRTLTVDGRAEALTGTGTFFPEVEGDSLPAFVLDARRGEPILTITAGHSPRTPDEVAMGRAAMSRHDLRLGDEVSIAVAGQTESFQLVGQAVFPVGDVNAFDDSLAVTSGGGSRFTLLDAESGANQILLTWAEGVDQAQARRDLEASGYRLLDRPRPPPTVTNLMQVDQVPGLLAVFFGSLGVVSLAYMLSASSRTRGRRFAVLAALGMCHRQLAAIVRWQAAAIGCAAGLIGIPTGVVLGRVVWTAITHSAGVAVSQATPAGPLAIAAASAVLVAISIAAAVSSRVRHLQLAATLRAD